MKKYLNRFLNLFRKNKKHYIDPKTGQIDLKYNKLTDDQDYFLGTRV